MTEKPKSIEEILKDFLIKCQLSQDYVQQDLLVSEIIFKAKQEIEEFYREYWKQKLLLNISLWEEFKLYNREIYNRIKKLFNGGK